MRLGTVRRIQANNVLDWRNCSGKAGVFLTGQVQIGRSPSARLCLQPLQLRLHTSVQNRGWKNK